MLDCVLHITEDLSYVAAARELAMNAILFKGPRRNTGDTYRMIILPPLESYKLNQSPLCKIQRYVLLGLVDDQISPIVVVNSKTILHDKTRRIKTRNIK